MVLDQIRKPNDIHKVDLKDFEKLAEEIRSLLIQTVSENGGHLASNLGSVELTLAIHNMLTFPKDKLIWDVGHQTYTHKILTGRKEQFDTLRKENGLSGFPKREESDCDAFDTGHSSNSISAGLGYVRARDLAGEDYKVFSVIGDGALTGGMAYEALNNAALLNTNYIIVLNDNNMSISQNIGGMSKYLSTLRTAQAYTGMKLSVTRGLNQIPVAGPAAIDALHRTKSSIKQLVIPGMLFENMGLTYLGPVDGHNMRQMMRVFKEAARVQGAVVVHVLTEKGRGYLPASLHPDRFHGTGPFNIQTGRAKSYGKGESWTKIFSEKLTELAAREKRLVGITAAMPDGTGLKLLSQTFPERFFDVGIAEQHAVTFAAGMALGGSIPVVAVYSSFMQRAIDQILEDVCLQKLHVVFALDRAGIVGADGETHHGCYDLTYLSMIPGMTILCPGDGRELEKMLEFAVLEMDGPVAIRYPRGNAPESIGEDTPIKYGKSRILKKGKGIAILAVGNMIRTAITAAQLLEEKGISATVVDVRFVKPMDTGMIDRLLEDHDLFVTVEENVQTGGFGEKAAAYIAQKNRGAGVKIFSLGDVFIRHGDTGKLLAENGLDPEQIADFILETRR